MTKILLLFMAVIAACTSTPKKRTIADEIIDRAIEASGGRKYQNCRVEFDFRGRHYVGERKGGKYQYERIFTDSTGLIRDVMDNLRFKRFRNDAEIAVADTMAAKYSRSVNSVLYFALLPYGLNDPAVNKTYLGEGELAGIKYDKVQVTFDEQGGGEDHEDVFVYWINKENAYIDYFAYSYATDGGGMRFRKANNPRIINGLRFQDYENYKPEDENAIALENMDIAFESKTLTLLSVIETENITVE